MLKRIRFISLIVAGSLLISLMSGCGGTDSESASGNGESTISTKVGEYPIETDEELTYWVQFNNQSTTGVSNFAELPFYKELEKKTGVKVNFIHPVEGQANEQFNLMLASGEYPDIIEKEFYDLPGGCERFIRDGYIIELNEVIDKYAPNLKSYLEKNPDVDRMVKTDTGVYYNFPFLRESNKNVFFGPIVRKDWLDELGLSEPETIDDWYTMMKAFKEKKNAESPLSFIIGQLKLSSAFVGAYGVRQGLYVENNEVKFGELEPEYKDFLQTFSKWYSEGLLDKNIASVDSKTVDANVLTNKTGASLGYTAGSLGKWMKAMEKKDPKFNVIPVKYPTLKKGEVAKFGQMGQAYEPFGSAGISTQCKNVELAARWLDYGYGEEGGLVYNFGTENVSYTMENGYPKYTELITNNPDGKSMADMLRLHIRPNGSGTYIVDKRYAEQNAALPVQQDSVRKWSETEAEQYILPKVTLTPEESTEAAKIVNELNTFINESVLKFIMGVDSLENYDKFISQLKQLGIDRYIEIYQAALDRYNKR